MKKQINNQFDRQLGGKLSRQLYLQLCGQLSGQLYLQLRKRLFWQLSEQLSKQLYWQLSWQLLEAKLPPQNTLDAIYLKLNQTTKINCQTPKKQYKVIKKPKE